MDEDATQMEVLLMVGTTFSSRQYLEKENADSNKILSEKEKLEEACWNGLLFEMLPEICSLASNAEPLFLWQIREGSRFLELELGALPVAIDKSSSINPYFFTEFQSYN